MSSVVETSLKRFLHSLRSVEMTVGVNMYIVPFFYNTEDGLKRHFPRLVSYAIRQKPIPKHWN